MPPEPLSPADIPDQSPHYARAVATLGEDHRIVARSDILASNGMKLVAQGSVIDRDLRERLKVHKLRLPLDLVLATDRPIDAPALARHATRLFDEDAAMRHLTERGGDPRGFGHALINLELSHPLAFRLTVMHEQYSAMFQHSLRVALIAHAIAARLGLSDNDKSLLALAALCHDMGEMHTDPALLASDHRVTAEERRFIHVHPLTGYYIMQQMQTLPAASMQAVLQHHERLDGSGYPHGLTAEKSHPLAKVLGAAEAVEGLVRRADMQRVDMLLRLNGRRFDASVIRALRDLLPVNADEATTSAPMNDAATRLAHIVHVLAAWPELAAGLETLAPDEPVCLFINTQLAALRSLALQAGIDPGNTQVLLDLAGEDPRVLNEMRLTLDELSWLMVDIANEIDRRVFMLDAAFRAQAERLSALLKAR